MTKFEAFHNLLPHDLSDEMAFHLLNCLNAFAFYFEAYYDDQIRRYRNQQKSSFEPIDDYWRDERDDVDDEIPF